MLDKCHLYIMKNDFGLYKIGISKDPEARVSQVKNMSGVNTWLVWISLPDDRGVIQSIEASIHKTLKSYREFGEFFRGKALDHFIAAWGVTDEILPKIKTQRFADIHHCKVRNRPQQHNMKVYSKPQLITVTEFNRHTCVDLSRMPQMW